MKQLISLVLLLSLNYFSFGQNNNPNAAVFKFVEETHDFGTVKEGPSITYDFVFTNTGKEPLIIQDCKASCGCTTPDWTKAPVLPGQKGKISVTYNTQGRAGTFDKEIYIASNAKSTEKRYVINIKGNVIAAGDATTPQANKPADKKH